LARCPSYWAEFLVFLKEKEFKITAQWMGGFCLQKNMKIFQKHYYFFNRGTESWRTLKVA
jgi:hypothetical protein